MREAGLRISKERRERWARLTKDDAFNTWLRPQVTAPDGSLDLDRLHEIARRYGVDKRVQYAHLNPGQQRMNLGNMLRKAVPPEVYEGRAPMAAPAAGDGAGPDEPLGRASVQELLRLHGAVMDELRRREVVRTSNSPVGDYAELLFSTAFGWNLENNSAAGHDAVDAEGVRYQIKSRRLARPNASRQLSALRGLPDGKFDYLAAVLFDGAYRVQKAVILPHAGLEARCRYSQHTNGWLLRLEDSCWDMPGARDVTEEVAATAAAI